MSDTPSTQDKLSAIFRQEAQKATINFPQLDGAFLVINQAANENIALLSAERLGLQSKEQMDALRQELVTRYQPATRPLADIRQDVNIISMGTDTSHEGIALNLPLEIRATLVFDHELGHLVVRDALNVTQENFRENCADAYAHLRAYQRWGLEKGDAALEAVRLYRLYKLAYYGAWTHYTIPTLEVVASLARQQDLTKLTPQETADLAYELAVKHAPAGYTLKMLHDSFADISSPVSEMSELEQLLHKATKDPHGPAATKDQYKYSDADALVLAIARSVQKNECHPQALPIAQEILGGLLAGQYQINGKTAELSQEASAAALAVTKGGTPKKATTSTAASLSGMYLQGR